MKVTCEGCKASFKVKGEVQPGKAFKFKCPKCGNVNRLKSDETVAPAPVTIPCEDCGTTIIKPPAGEPSLCDQCRASRAVKEAQAMRTQAEESDLPEGVEFPDDLFAGDGDEPPMPQEIEEPPEPETAAPPPPPEPKPAPTPSEREEDMAPDLAMPRAAKVKPRIEPVEAPKMPEQVAAKPPPEDEDEEDEIVTIGAPPQKPATPDSQYRVRSSDGLIIGPIKLGTLRDLIVARKVHSDEEFSRDEGIWMSMADFPELFEIFQSQSVARSKEEEEEVVEDDLSRVMLSKDKILSLLKVKKKCVGCGEEIFVIEDIPNPLCDQCRIEALVTKKKVAQSGGEAMFRIRSPDGLVLGPLRKSTVEDLVAAKNIRGVEEVSVSDGPWRPIIEVQELADLFHEPVEDVIDLTETADG